MRLSNTLHCLSSAIAKGYKVDNALTLEENYQEALEYLWEKRPKVMPVVDGRYDRRTACMTWKSPEGTDCELIQPLPYINNRYEHVHQREDGTLYRVVSR